MKDKRTVTPTTWMVSHESSFQAKGGSWKTGWPPSCLKKIQSQKWHSKNSWYVPASEHSEVPVFPDAATLPKTGFIRANEDPTGFFGVATEQRNYLSLNLNSNTCFVRSFGQSILRRTFLKTFSHIPVVSGDSAYCKLMLLSWCCPQLWTSQLEPTLLVSLFHGERM